MKNNKKAEILRNEFRILSKAISKCSDKENISQIELELQEKHSELYKLCRDDYLEKCEVLFNKTRDLLVSELEGFLGGEKDYIVNKIGAALIAYAIFDCKEEKIGHAIDGSVADIKKTIALLRN